MKILVFINVGNTPMSEETMAAKLSKICLFHGGILDQSLDNRSVWIVKTKFSEEFKNHYTQSFWKRNLEAGIHINWNYCRIYHFIIFWNG